MIGASQGYIDLINERTKKKIEADYIGSKLKFPLRPSSAGGCTRALAYQTNEYLGNASYEHDRFPPNVFRLLNLGSYIETHAFEQFKQLEPEYQIKFQQQKVSLGWIHSTVKPDFKQEITGSIDGVLWSNTHKCVLDIKSVKDWSTGRFATHWSDVSKKLGDMKSVQALSKISFYVDDLPAFLNELKMPFFEANFYQLNGYAHSDFIKSHGIDHAAIIQYNKNTSEMREVRFRPSEELFNKVMKKFQRALDGALQSKPEVVPRDHDLKTAITCRYCRFFNQCKLDQIKEMRNGINKT